MDTRRTVLFQPLNHIGLGHINRLAVIAFALRELDDSIRTPFVVEEAAHVLLDSLGLPYIPLTSSHSLNKGLAWSAWTENERSAVQGEISRSILRALAPNIVVFDFLPNSAFADVVVKAGIPIVFCVREMRRLSEYLPTVRDLLDCVRLIIIPHSEGTFTLPEDLAGKCCFVGQIARDSGPSASQRRDLTAPRILITGGGGGYPGTVEFYNLASKATATLRENYPALKSQLNAGPLFRDWSLLQPADGISVTPLNLT